MLSLEYIRENLELVKKAAKNKNRVVDFTRLIKLADEERKLLTEIGRIREKRNILAKQGKSEESIKKGKKLKTELKAIELQQKKTTQELQAIILKVPNVPYDEVPIGKDDKDNQEIKKVGQMPKFTFKPKTYLELIELHDLADLKRGVKISGFRGYFLKNQLATLQFALLSFAFNKLAAKGYTPIIAPALVKEFTLFGSGQFPWGRREVYALEEDQLFLAGTAEVPVTAYFANEMLSESELPHKFVAFSPCFRREIGSYGKDTQGFYRVHEFWKIEQVIIAEADDKKARAYHEELQANGESLMRELGLSYRVLLMCTGDMGEPQAKKYDIEAWIPSRNGYGELGSNSIMTDFQTRRLKIRYRTKSGQTKYAYSFNNTAVATPRTLIAILENYQQKDGSIKVPVVLQKFCGFDTISKSKDKLK